MGNVSEINQKTVKNLSLKDYKSPELIYFGLVRELTTGGSSGNEMMDGSNGDNKKLA